MLIIICLLSGCSTDSNNSDITLNLENSYDSGYDDGYNDGYDACLNRPKKEIFEDEYNDFKSMIVNLMYDYKYDTVQEIQHYYPDIVDKALEDEFGTTSIADITEYLEDYRKEQEETVVAICEFCKRTVYAIDAIRRSSCEALHDLSYDCPTCTYVHSKCLYENDPPRIEINP